jgi:hypothetical protein
MNLESYITWFKAHERAVLLAGVLMFGGYGVNKAYDYLIKHDQVQAQIANQQAQAAATKVVTDDTTNKLLLVQLQTLQQQVQLQSQRIDQAMQQRAAATQTQKRTDDQSAPAELAVRIQKILGVGTIKVDTQNSTIDYSLDAAHADADNLEDLQQSKLDVNDLKTQIVGCKTVTDKQADTITGLKNQVGDGTLALIAEQHSHADDVKTLKAEKKKAWLNGFKWGAITGFLGSLFVHKP